MARESPAFSWDEVELPHLALDYVLLLGALLAGADLAYAEAKFTPLGDAWPWHLLVVALFYAGLAFRYDSRVLLSLALSTFAAWRGVSAARLEHALWMGGEDLVRVNAAGCGLLFLARGRSPAAPLVQGALRAGGHAPRLAPAARRGGSALGTADGAMVRAAPRSSWPPSSRRSPAGSDASR